MGAIVALKIAMPYVLMASTMMTIPSLIAKIATATEKPPASKKVMPHAAMAKTTTAIPMLIVMIGIVKN